MVYVDDMAAPFGRMKMSHLIADTTEELLAMVDAIGVQRKWIQHAGTYKEHFDISQSKRQLALAHGAQPITWKEYAHKVGARRTQILERPHDPPMM
jgi:hypothetical protein